MNDRYIVLHEAPTPMEYKAIRLEGGLSQKSEQSVKIGLKNSLFTVCIYDEHVLIGMGRITGDGGASFQIVDIVVKPSYRRQGLGKRIMLELTNYLNENTYPGSYVSLIADEPADKLYEKFGFEYIIATSHGMVRKY